MTGRITLSNGQSADTHSDVDATEALRIISVDASGTATIALRLEALRGSEDGEDISRPPN